jgi:ATP-dependent Clp protease ATP-binding subunit ClpB
MVGQVMPICSIASAIRRRDNGWHDEDKPMVFLFLVCCRGVFLDLTA